MNQAKHMAKKFEGLPSIIRGVVSGLILGSSSEDEDEISVALALAPN